MSQTSYPTSLTAGIRGMLGNLNPLSIFSYAAEAALTFGRYVTKGSDAEKEVNVPSDSTHITDIANFRGVVVREHGHENLESSDTEIAANDSVNVLAGGDIWVYIEQTVTPDDPVFVRFSAGVGEVAGSFRKDADGADAAELPNARYIKGGTAGGAALLRLVN